MRRHKRSHRSSSREENRSDKRKKTEIEERLRRLERHFVSQHRSRRSRSRSRIPSRPRRRSHSRSGSTRASRTEGTSATLPSRSSSPFNGSRGSTPLRGSRGSTPLTGSGGFTPPLNNKGTRNSKNIPDNEILLVKDMCLERDLNTEILKCLGEDPEESKSINIELHKALVPRWTYVLRNGLSKEDRVEILKRYPCPKDVEALKSPILNPEIFQAVSKVSLAKDKYQVLMQDQLASGISALGIIFTKVLLDDSVFAKSLVPELSNTAKILTDLFHTFSIQRRSYLIPQLNPMAMSLARSTEIDKFLFSSTFNEQLRIAKEVEKHSKEVKVTTVERSGTGKRAGNLNWKGSSRVKRNPRQYGQLSQNRFQQGAYQQRRRRY